MRDKPKITIGICAYNEEKNILNIMNDVIAQKQDHYVLEKVVVNCDGCTDNTVPLLKKLKKKNHKIDLIINEKSLGKIFRMNEVFRKNKSQILICADADIRLLNNEVFNELVRTMTSNRADIVGAKDVPAEARTFFERVLKCWIAVWDDAKWSHNKGSNVYTLSARLMALNKDFIDHIKIPVEVAIDDQYLFYTALLQQKKYCPCPESVAVYKLPSTLQDFTKQSLRYEKTKALLISHFGTWISVHEKIPLRTKLHSISKVILRDPFFFNDRSRIKHHFKN